MYAIRSYDVGLRGVGSGEPGDSAAKGSEFCLHRLQHAIGGLGSRVAVNM